MDSKGDEERRLRGDTGRRGGPAWEEKSVRALRRYLGFSQREMADELGTRQQTVSEWETGLYRPRGASRRLLTIIAERARFEYGVPDEQEEAEKGQGEAEARGRS